MLVGYDQSGEQGSVSAQESDLASAQVPSAPVGDGSAFMAGRFTSSGHRGTRASSATA